MRNFNKFLETRTVVRERKSERERESLNYMEEIIRIFHWCAGIHNKLKERDGVTEKKRRRNVFF